MPRAFSVKIYADSANTSSRVTPSTSSDPKKNSKFSTLRRAYQRTRASLSRLTTAAVVVLPLRIMSIPHIYKRYSTIYNRGLFDFGSEDAAPHGHCSQSEAFRASNPHSLARVITGKFGLGFARRRRSREPNLERRLGSDVLEAAERRAGNSSHSAGPKAQGRECT